MFIERPQSNRLDQGRQRPTTWKEEGSDSIQVYSTSRSFEACKETMRLSVVYSSNRNAYRRDRVLRASNERDVV